MAYKTARDFFKNVKLKRADGRDFYTVAQVADGIGVDCGKILQILKSPDIWGETWFSIS